jgi:hypothetical protein
MATQERFKKTSVPLAGNQCAAGASDFVDESNTRNLKSVPECEGFKCTI